MRAFTQTGLFGELLAPMDAETARLQVELDRLARTIEDKTTANATLPKSKRKPTKADENSLSRLRGQLNDVQEKKRGHLSGDLRQLKHLSLGNLLAFLGAALDDEPGRGGTFTQDEITAEVITASYEGKREREIRARLGLDLAPSIEHNDTPFGEIKFGNANVEPFRTYQAGRKHWGSAFRRIIRTWPEEAFNPEVWDALFDGEVSAGKLYSEFPSELRELIHQTMRPENVLSTYDRGIFYATDAAYVHVPVSDYARAFSLVCITQMGPKYRIRRDYVESRLSATLPAEDVPEQVTVHTDGKATLETRPVVVPEKLSHHRPTDVDGGDTLDGSKTDASLVNEGTAVLPEAVSGKVLGKVSRVRVDDVRLLLKGLAELLPDVPDGRPRAVVNLDVRG